MAKYVMPLSYIMNIVCRNSWKSVGCCNGVTDIFMHGIQIVKEGKVIHDFEFPFEVHLTAGMIHFKKDGIERPVQIAELEETREEIKTIIKNCSSGGVLERRTLIVIVETIPVQVITLPLLSGESFAGIYDVFIPQLVNEGIESNEYSVLLNGNISFNTEIPVEDEPYTITINYWVRL